VQISCILYNARCLVTANNLAAFHYILYSCKYSVILVCESWLSEGITNGLLDPERKYNIIRRDRTTGRCGGVCIAVSRDMSYIEVYKGLNDVELLSIDVLRGRAKYRFVLIYRPPRYDVESKSCMNNIIESLAALCKVKWPVFIVGDLNCPDICWQSFSAPADKIQNYLIDFVCESGFSQFVTEGTRERNILDLVLCNEPLILTNIDVQCPVGSSDHNSVQFSITTSNVVESQPTVGSDNCTERVYMWDEANYDAITAYLECIDWPK